MKDTLELISNSDIKGVIDNSKYNIWLIIALIEFVIILLMFVKIRKHKWINNIDTDLEKLKGEKSNKIDMNNIVNSIYSSETLYKDLSKKYHPDRFINEEDREKANTIFQEITKNKRNYQKLIELQQLAQKTFKI